MLKKTFSLGKMMLASVGTIALIALVSWVWRPADTLVPNDLIGEWHTSDANYSDRFFEIAPVSVSFGTGGGTVATGFIKKVKAVPQGARTLYTISYTTDETVNQVSFYYETAKGKVIRFTNREGVAWTKD